ncbi:MAG: hypothetical protein NTZ14_16490 [Hyphomicrobiales bacterium]|nr:hypothetical protein [Hyphomicrobiales bacterium]
MNIGSSSAIIRRAKSMNRGDRFPADVIEHAVWLYVRFSLSRKHTLTRMAYHRRPQMAEEHDADPAAVPLAGTEPGREYL